MILRDNFTPAEVKTFLKRAGSKVAVQTAFDGAWIYAEKSSFIESFLTGPIFTDYDGAPAVFSCFTTANCPNVMHIVAGTYCVEVPA